MTTHSTKTCAPPGYIKDDAREGLVDDEQEPVAYDKTEMNCFVQELYDKKMCEGKHGHYETMFHCVHQAIKRVTPPAAQRQWVGLTEDQIDDIWNRYCDEMGEASINDAYDIVRAIEAAHGITGEKK